MLFINGFFNASFGGKVRPPFILLIGLVLVSNKLLELVTANNPVQDLNAEPVTVDALLRQATTGKLWERNEAEQH